MLKPCEAVSSEQIKTLERDNHRFGKAIIQLDEGSVYLWESGKGGESVEFSAQDFKKICEWYLGRNNGD